MTKKIALGKWVHVVSIVWIVTFYEQLLVNVITGWYCAKCDIEQPYLKAFSPVTPPWLLEAPRITHIPIWGV